MNETNLGGFPENQLKETEKSKIEAERIKNTAKMLDGEGVHVDKYSNYESTSARMLEDEHGKIHFIPSRNQLKKARYEMYLGLLKNEINKAKEEGRDKEARLLKSRLRNDAEILDKTWGRGFDRSYGDYKTERSDIDVIAEGDKTRLVIPDDVIDSARLEMKEDFVIRGKMQKFIETLPRREQIWDEAEKQTFSPIPFRENMSQAFSTFELGENETVSQKAKREGAKALEKYLTGEKYTYIGDTANSRDCDVPIEIIQGIEVATGEKISAKRVGSVHFSYDTNKNLAAISLALDKDTENQELNDAIEQTYKDFPPIERRDGYCKYPDQKTLKDRERAEEKIIAEARQNTPMLFEGTYVIKFSGEKYFLPNIIWKQYPYLRPNGKIIMPFAGGPSRGIFDENTFFASRDIDSSAGRVGFSDADTDSYGYSEGVERSNGKTYFQGREMPKAFFSVDQETGTRIYKLDVMDEMMEILPEAEKK